ncbi:hypothetical protein AMTR_s00032p00079260 [Amborella trichopoda]|uniref:non-specific serine/threonine protein kinase n=1 Tax=Amborella trichopoda TaxID=13333 RepID=U5CXB7_AMBTC|nr:hypothetical protein AMTR_s00032p00079260 [Amborella trichopoda]
MEAFNSSSSLSILALCSFLISFLVCTSEAQTLDPKEVMALRSISEKWGLSSSVSWNISGEPCSGTAIDNSKIEDPNNNPAIKCDCRANNGTTCHIKEMKVYSLSVSGSIPEEIANLSFLTNLNLAENHLTGPLPAFIGNLTSMQYLSFAANMLSGTIPKELGNLRDLLSLRFSSNNFSGVLPPDLGNLVKLEQIYIDSAGVSGEIPSTLSKLQNLKYVWASDNGFPGKIPDFIGNWTNLQTLKLQGNSFEGPIPSSFANLTSLMDLRISELSNGSSSLDFIKNMKNLTILVLRNNMISGNISSEIVDFAQLRHLFLGNNNLSGSLPQQKSSSLSTIDLSYNQLAGSFPLWMNSQNLQMNLVGNSFVIGNSNNSVTPIGLDCLQRTFPCNRNNPRYSYFAINSGGKQITSADGTVFEQDDANIGMASYFVAESQRWAVSNAGRFVDSSSAQYIQTNKSQFTNTLDPELFQTMRLSPGSLRYYGLGLQNGNYTVKLQFSEIEYPSPPDWHSTGRRVFNVYAQGKLKLKDFDVRKEAGGNSFVAVTREFNASVTENFLEIQFSWAGKGTCCIPNQGTYGPLISAISASPADFLPTVSNTPPSTSQKKNKTGLIVGIVVSSGVVCLVAFGAIFVLKQRKKRGLSDEEFLVMGTRRNTFSYSVLKAATEDFNAKNKLGDGGFGAVYKGTLLDGTIVAVKQLSVTSHQGKDQFVTEIATISAVQHRNLVRLYGCCVEGDQRLLVYEYLENKSLDQALFGKNVLHLDWPTRYEICMGTARGLAYLHEESRPRIVHRDVKASNILLDVDLNPKISDFGLAKLYDDNKTHISTRVAGTIGYLAPEYAMRGHLTEKADVFGLELWFLRYLVEGQIRMPAWQLLEDNRELDLVDQRLTGLNEEQVIRLIGVALLCTQASPTQRPSMSRVVAMLTGDVEVTRVTSRPRYLTDWHIDDINSSIGEDITSS